MAWKLLLVSVLSTWGLISWEKSPTTIQTFLPHSPHFPTPPSPQNLSLTQLFPPRSAARNYGTNLTPFVLLEVAPPNSILYYTLISTKCSSSLIHTLIPTFRSSRNCFYTQNLRLRWSRGSVLAFGTQVRGFAPRRSRRIFRAKKILSAPSFGGDVKPLVPCRSFTACKRSLNVRWKS